MSPLTNVFSLRLSPRPPTGDFGGYILGRLTVARPTVNGDEFVPYCNLPADISTQKKSVKKKTSAMFPLKNNSNKENHRRPRKTFCPNLQKKNHRRPQKKKIIAPHRETLCPNLLSENKRDFLSGKTMSVNNQSHYEKKYFLNNKSSSCKFVFLVSRNKQIKSVCLCVECVPPIKSVCSKLQSRGEHILHLENTFYLEVEGGEHLKKRPTV